MSLAQAPEELQNKFIELGFKKMWINKEFQKFTKTFEGRMDQEDMSVSTKDFVDSIGADLVESKVFQFLFDGNCDGKVSFDEVLQAYGFMEMDDMEVQAKLFFGLIDKDGNGMLSRIEMKQFLAIHHLKRTGNLPEAADQAELDSVLEQIFAAGDEIALKDFLESDHGMMTMVTFNLM